MSDYSTRSLIVVEDDMAHRNERSLHFEKFGWKRYMLSMSQQVTNSFQTKRYIALVIVLLTREVGAANAAITKGNTNPTSLSFRDVTATLEATPSVHVFNKRTVVVVLSCSWEGARAGPRTARYRWLLDGKAINTSTRPDHYSLRHSGASLTLVGPGRDDEGTYRCQAMSTNGHVIANSTAALVHKDVPISGNTQVITKGTRGRLRCPSTGTGHSAVIWNRDGIQLLNGTKYRHTNGPDLEIVSVDWDDMGEYVCTVVASNGHPDHKIYVSVQGPPIPPSKIHAQTSSNGYIPCNNVVLSWMAPEFNGHKPVLVYEVACDKQISGALQPFFRTVTGKTTAAVPVDQHGVENVCFVRANNTLGYSNWSTYYFQCRFDYNSEPLPPTAAKTVSTATGTARSGLTFTSSIAVHPTSDGSQDLPNETTKPSKTRNLNFQVSGPLYNVLPNSTRHVLSPSSTDEPMGPPGKQNYPAIVTAILPGAAVFIAIWVMIYKHKKTTKKKIYDLELSQDKHSKQVQEMKEGLKQTSVYQQKQSLENADLLVENGNSMPDPT
ncbi:titin-like [Corticium candelabrum]|uniref:titin-like n=1 Tax=Corticium candelabrum TaxID=121492 RepID=UPI002E317592|nr:titin-like [Corticium candelabrum]